MNRKYFFILTFAGLVGVCVLFAFVSRNFSLNYEVRVKILQNPNRERDAVDLPVLERRSGTFRSVTNASASDKGGATNPSVIDQSITTAERHNETPTSDSLQKWQYITMSDDLDLRSDWQVQQVNKFCTKYEQDWKEYILPRGNRRHFLFRHLIYSPTRKFIFCFLPKAGCSTLRRLVFVMENVIPLESVHYNWSAEIEHNYLLPAMKETSFMNVHLKDWERIAKLREYFKFMMIRNPLERLVSAYRDKIEPPLEFCDHDRRHDPLVYHLKYVKNMEYFQAHCRLILSKYHPVIFKKWAQANGNYSLSVDFVTYVKWIVDTRDVDLNEHFSSIIFNAAPCRVRYHLYLNFKNYSREVRLLIQKLNTSSEYFVDHNSHSSPQEETRATLPYYYSLLSAELKRKLFARMARDLDFYYHLFPEEQFSHVELLGVNQHIYTDNFHFQP